MENDYLTELEIESVGADVVAGGQHGHHHHADAQRRQQPVVRRDAVLLRYTTNFL